MVVVEPCKPPWWWWWRQGSHDVCGTPAGHPWTARLTLVDVDVDDDRDERCLCQRNRLLDADKTSGRGRRAG